MMTTEHDTADRPTSPLEHLVRRLREFEGSDALGNGDFSACQEAARQLELLMAAAERREVVLQATRDAWNADLVEWRDRNERLREIAVAAMIFAESLPDDLGRGSLNGMKVQLAHRARSALDA